MSINGHAPVSIREQFRQAVDPFNKPTTDELKYLTGKLWNCTDTMPASTCDDVDLPSGSSYEQAARYLRGKLE